MISLLFLVQSMDVADNTPQQAVDATAFACTFVKIDEGSGSTSQFDILGTIPAMPEGHDPNARFPMQLGSKSGSPLSGPASAKSLTSSQWFRDYQVYRQAGAQSYTLNLFLRKAGRSVAYLTQYDGAWGQEPYRYEAVGLCVAEFEPKTEVRP